MVEGIHGLLVQPPGFSIFVGKSDFLSVVEILAEDTGVSPEQRRLCLQFAEGLETYQNGQRPEAQGVSPPFWPIFLTTARPGSGYIAARRAATVPHARMSREWSA